MIRISVPGSLVHRDLVLRAVASSCKLVGSNRDDLQEASHAAHQLHDDFEAKVVSAFGEAFNNIAIHGYGCAATGQVEIDIEPSPDRLTLIVRDTGKSFDPEAVPMPNLEGLPESGMGLYIIRSFMDVVEYRPGSEGRPNVLTLVKLLDASPEARELQTSQASAPRNPKRQ